MRPYLLWQGTIVDFPEFYQVGRSRIRVMDDDNIFIVSLLSAGCKIIGTRDHNTLVNDQYFVMHQVIISIQEYIDACLHETIVFRTDVGCYLICLHDSRHSYSFSSAGNDGISKGISGKRISQEVDAFLRR